MKITIYIKVHHVKSSHPSSSMSVIYAVAITRTNNQS